MSLLGRKRRRKFRRFRRGGLSVATVVLFIAAIWIVGLFQFAATIPRTLSTETLRTDAIVVLTGGRGRLSEGLDLLDKNRADKLFVSGVYRGVDVKRLLKMFRHDQESLESRVGIGNAVNTSGNAKETALWVNENGIKSLRLVTSAYHMPRSLLEFRYALSEIRLVPHPVFTQNVKQERWWAWPGTVVLIAGEYTKFLMAWLRHVGIDAANRLRKKS
jgi:uncharacterized SAM-binding protein YcdF (DUF218 family)